MIRINEGLEYPAVDAYALLNAKLSDSGGDYPLPISPFDLADRLGVEVFAANFPDALSGYTEWVDGRPRIFINGNHHLHRQRFTCAHELGHIQEALNLNEYEPAWRDEIAANGDDASEIYANRYAAAILMPADAVTKFHEIGLDEAQLASKFKVSRSSMGWRLRNLGLAHE